MSLEKATTLLEQRRAPEFEGYVNNFLYRNAVVLRQHEFDVLVSFTFNFGPEVWVEIDENTGDLFWRVAKFIRGRAPFDPVLARAVFTEGYANPELQNRRNTEAEVFINGHRYS